jgi:hypothetical protein
MGCSFGGLTADDDAAAPDAASPERDVASFMPMTDSWARHLNYLFYLIKTTYWIVVQKSCKI